MLAKVSNSSKSSNLCWFPDKPQHLVVLAWDAACTIGCCKLFAWSGPGTPHVMGNSLNSAHLGRRCRLDPLIFCCSSQPATPATAVATSHLPSSHCTWLQPHSHSSSTLGPWPVQSYLSSCPRVCQARHRQRGPNMCLLNIYSVLSSATTTVSTTGSNPGNASSLEGRLLSSVSLQPTYSASVPPPSLNVCPPVTSLLLFCSPSVALLILGCRNSCWKIMDFFFSFFFIWGAVCRCPRFPTAKLLLYFFWCVIRSSFHICYVVLFGKMLVFRSSRLNAAKMPILFF